MAKRARPPAPGRLAATNSGRWLPGQTGDFIISRTGKIIATLFVCGAASVHGSLARAQSCPIAASDIDTDRPDATNSSRTVPAAGLQVENGLNIAAGFGFNRKSPKSVPRPRIKRLAGQLLVTNPTML
jgi:hypothetical protein